MKNINCLEKINFKNIVNELNVGIIVTNNKGYVLFANNFAEKLLFLVKGKYKFVKLIELCPNIFKNGKLINCININNKIVQAKLEKFLEYNVILLQDISELDKIKKESRLLKTVFDSMHEGVQITNQDDVIIFNNKFSEINEDLKTEFVIDKKVVDVYDITEESCVHRNVRLTGKPIIEKYYEYHARDGKKINVIASTYPYFEDNKVVAVYSVNRDVSKLKDFITDSINLKKKLMDMENRGGNSASYIFDNIIGESKIFKNTIKFAKKIAGSNSSVLIYGETGTGKELFAQSIHNASVFSDGPFIAINCAAIPETLLESILFGTAKGAFTGAVEKPGLFEEAEGGTLFLDEINSMGYNLQSKLLRVIQEKIVKRVSGSIERKVNCRILASTNKDPIEAVMKKEIREDLYYRINAVMLYIPPLRERHEDILLLCKHFIKKYNMKFGTNIENVSEEVKDSFIKYNWPGNVRELEHIIEGAMNMVEFGENTIRLEHIPIYQRRNFRKKVINLDNRVIQDKGNLKESLDEFEKIFIYNHLKKNKYNITKTSEELGVSRQSLQYRIKKYDINTR